MCHICEMQRNPDHETKIKIVRFTKDMLVYKERAEVFLKGSGMNIEALEKMQSEELDKIFKSHFKDTEDDHLLFHDLVTKMLFAFALGDSFDTEAMERDLENDRANLN